MRAREAAATMLGAPAEVAPVRGGRNSRIFHVRSAGGEYALKSYPASGDPRDRLGTEAGALRLMQGMAVPRLHAVDRERGFLLLGWIDGAPVDDVTDADIDAGVAFLTAVHALRNHADAAAQPRASEACLSGAEIARQIEARLARLRATGERALIDSLTAISPRRSRARWRRRARRSLRALILRRTSRTNGKPSCRPTSAITMPCAGRTARSRSWISSISAGTIR
jgi:hypothetical protein